MQPAEQQHSVGNWTLRALVILLLITLFLFLTAPITANFIAKAYIAKNMRAQDLPSTGGEYGWSVYDDPPETRRGP